MPTNTDLDHQEIAELAYQFYEDGGRQAGFEEDHWLKAEAQIRERRRRAAQDDDTAADGDLS
ncbi:MAG: DUF2934 domain-containing protein [Acidobacteriota bacterium]|nr:DUF2934 domain-containing protein [Acidobacteriota bacterium]